MKLLQFKAVWCNPCKLQTKEFKENPIDVEIEAVDIDNDETNLTTKYKVRSVPTMVLIGDNNEVIEKWPGFTKSEVINKVIKEKNQTNEENKDVNG